MRHKLLQACEGRETEVVSLVSNPKATRALDETVAQSPEDMRQRIECVQEDLRDIEKFYNISISPHRKTRLREYFVKQLTELHTICFGSLDQQNKVDYLLLQNFIKRSLRQLDLDEEKDNKTKVLLPFGPMIILLCERRQEMEPMKAKTAAKDLHGIGIEIEDTMAKVNGGKIKLDKMSAYRAAKSIDCLRSDLAEWFGFYKGYDPIFSWWVPKPYAHVDEMLKEFAEVIRRELVGIKPGDEDAIVGDPIGLKGLQADLNAEMIPYTPEELIRIGESEYEWCEKEMKKASQKLEYADDWRAALEYVKDLYVEPGKQPELIRDLAAEAVDYVKEKDLVTVPGLCEETWRMFMMSPVRQKVNPFFLGGDSILVSYPTDGMGHEAKLMSMRGNNIHFARSTVFHELIPGHHLQLFMNARHRPYRRMFDTPFWIEGWSFYWEMVLWDKDFPMTPENRIGMLFWRMHRCARIIFSLKFHLGLMTPQQCIDLLVDMVGHERSTAEGEVRRSFNGDYSPLYQAGYMLGGLQLYSLRHELVIKGKMSEKQFHDRVLQENEMPIELLRALLEEKPLTADYKANWRFYSLPM
jgi:uncharacterized protein (DUF885 family)